MLEVSGLVKRYGEVVALDECSLQVPAGHLVGLPGPNGAGQTTVMRTLFGLVLPDGGTARRGGAGSRLTRAAGGGSGTCRRPAAACGREAGRGQSL